MQLLTESYQSFAVLDASDKSSPLFRITIRRTKLLTENSMPADEIGRMAKRRLRAAGLPSGFSPHSFRVTTITDLLSQGVPSRMCKISTAVLTPGPLDCTIGGNAK